MKITEYSEWDGSIPALVANMPNEAYHKHESISNSGLTAVNRSPAHYFFAAPYEGSRAMQIGTAFHTALLEPERFKSEYISVDGVNDRRKSAYLEAAKVYGGEKTLTQNEGDSVKIMTASVMSNESARKELSKTGYAELSAFLRDEKTGVTMRVRFDWITTDGVIVDIKKTQDCREHKFSRSLFDYRYHVQAAMYSDAYKQLHALGLISAPFKAFKILAIEEQPPCANILYDIDPLALMLGNKTYREDLQTYADSLASQSWESYSGSGVVTLPEWVLNQMMEGDGNE